MKRPRIKTKPALVYSVRRAELENIQVLTIVSPSDSARQKLEALFRPQVSLA